eukprot:1230986-Amphidinium_carterae.2
MLGDLLSTGVRVAPIWIATECNPADAPTRKKKIPAPQEPSELFEMQKERVLEQHPWTIAITAHEWSERFSTHDLPFDATRGFPGEGPRVSLEKMIIGPVKEKQGMTDLRVQVQPATLKRYRTKYEPWALWLQNEGLPAPELVTNSVALDAIMASYIQHLYNIDLKQHALIMERWRLHEKERRKKEADEMRRMSAAEACITEEEDGRRAPDGRTQEEDGGSIQEEERVSSREKEASRTRKRKTFQRCTAEKVE